jgi:predicted amidohydrolase YtcJ
VSAAVFFNGNLLTQNPAQPRAEAMAVSEGRITAVASRDEDNRGSLTPGKWADAIVVDEAPFQMRPEAVGRNSRRGNVRRWRAPRLRVDNAAEEAPIHHKYVAPNRTGSLPQRH